MLKITRKEGLMKKLALAMFLAFCCLSVAQAGPNHNDGLAAKSKGQWKDAENYFKLGCYKEKVDSSCKELEQLYEFGKGSDVKKTPDVQSKPMKNAARYRLAKEPTAATK